MLKALEDRGIKPDNIVGTSIGSIVGSLYASGYSAYQIDSIARNTDWEKLFSLVEQQERSQFLLDRKQIEDRNLFRLRFNNLKLELPQSISEGVFIKSFLQELLWKAPVKSFGNFDNLAFRFRAVSTDIVSGRSVALKSGSLVQAVMASAAIPLRLPPVRIDSMILVDGGVKANIPTLASKEFENSIVVAVNTTSPLLNYDDLNSPINIADQVVSILMKDITDSTKIISDLLVEPSIGNYDNTDFGNIDSIIDIGYTYGNKLALELINNYEVEWDFISSAKDSRIELLENFDEFDQKVNIGKTNKNKTEIYRTLSSLESDFSIIKKQFNTTSLITYQVDPGIIKRINYDSKASSFLIDRELEFSVGELLSGKELNKTYHNLVNSGFFKEIDIEVESLDTGIAVNVKAIENPRQNFLFGLRVDNERFTQIGSDLYYENLFNLGIRFGVRAAGGSRNQYLNFTLANPRVWQTPLSYRLNLYYSNYINNRFSQLFTGNSKEFEVESEYLERRAGASFELGLLAQNFGKIIFGYRDEHQTFFDRGGDEDFYRLSTAKIGMQIDYEDDPDITKSGSKIEIFFETNVNSDDGYEFTKFSSSSRFTKSFGRHIFTPTFQFGYADATLRLPEYFSLGGIYNFYGLRQLQSRGRQILLASLEYKFESPIEIFFPTFFTVRYDLGNTWEEQATIKFLGLRQGIGAGLIFRTPIGPARFSMGQSFQQLEENGLTLKGTILFYFTIGTKI